MAARGPYTASKSAWMAQPVGSTTQYGNGTTEIITIGPAPAETPGDPDIKGRGVYEFSGADMADFFASASSVTDGEIEMTVAANDCIGSRGGTNRILLEEMTADFTQKAVVGNCKIGSGAGTGVWGISNSVTTANRALHSSGAHSTGDKLTWSIGPMLAARLAAGRTSEAFRFRLIAANADGSGYAETTAARLISLCSTEDPTSGNRPKLSGNVGTTAPSVNKNFSDSGAGTSDLSLTQSGGNPSFFDGAEGEESFSTGTSVVWETDFDSGGNGRAKALVPDNKASHAVLLDVDETDILMVVCFRVNKVLQSGTMAARIIGRTNAIATTYYVASARMFADGASIWLYINKVVDGVATQIAVLPDAATLVANSDYWIMFVADGASPTIVSAKLWRADEDEPEWQIVAQDTEADLQGPGAVGLSVFVIGVSNAPITFSFDDFAVSVP